MPSKHISGVLNESLKDNKSTVLSDIRRESDVNHQSKWTIMTIFGGI